MSSMLPHLVYIQVGYSLQKHLNPIHFEWFAYDTYPFQVQFHKHMHSTSPQH
jgi:hypothetical protein